MKNFLFVSAIVMLLVITGSVIWYLTKYIPQKDQAAQEYKQRQDELVQDNKQQELRDQEQKDLLMVQQNCLKIAQDGIKNEQSQLVQVSVLKYNYDGSSGNCYALDSTTFDDLSNPKDSLSVESLVNASENNPMASCQGYTLDIQQTNWTCRIKQQQNWVNVSKVQFDNYLNSYFGD